MSFVKGMECSYVDCKKKAKYERIIEENPRPLCSKHFNYEKKKYGFVGIRAYVPIKECHPEHIL